jgi:hypothetical protein
MLIAELRDRVLSKLGENGPIYGGDIEMAAENALHRFATNVAYSPRRWMRELLRKDFSVTITSGTGDLTASLTASEPLMIDRSWADNFFITSGTTPLQPLPDRTQLSFTRSTMFIYYTIDGNTIRTRNTDGSLSSLSTTLTITGNYVPTLANVPDQLTDDFVDVVVAYLLEDKTDVQYYGTLRSDRGESKQPSAASDNQ